MMSRKNMDCYCYAMPAGLTEISNVCVVTQYEDPKISANNNVIVVILHVRGKKRARQY
jgi:hypothetical protein